MTVRELLRDSLCSVWITTDEDPNQSEPEIKVDAHTDREEQDFLSEQILNSEIYLMDAPQHGVIYVSLYWDRKGGDDE